MAEKNYLWNEGETAKEFATRLQSQLDEYKKKILDLKTVEEVEAEEKVCIEEAEKFFKNSEDRFRGLRCRDSLFFYILYSQTKHMRPKGV